MVWSSLLIYLLDSSENVLRDDDSDFMSRLKYFSLEISMVCAQNMDMKSHDFTHNVSSSSRCQECSYHPTHVHLSEVMKEMLYLIISPYSTPIFLYATNHLLYYRY